MADSQRLVSLDVFRGLTIAGMVLVNNPGGSPVYWPLDHAEWNGLTPTDWIFPFFLFIVGVSISISLGRRDKGSAEKVYGKVIKRSVTIYLLGAAVSVLPFFQFQASDAPDLLKLLIWIGLAAALFFALLRNWWMAGACLAFGLIGIAALNIAGYNIVAYNYGTLRIMGVLQRIAVVYLITSIIFLNTGWRTQVGISIVLLLGYWALITLVPVPGCEVTTMNDKACNIAAFVDRTILTEDHIWRAGKVYDPEGILSTIPAIVTCISGVLTGLWITRKHHITAKNVVAFKRPGQLGLLENDTELARDASDAEKRRREVGSLTADNTQNDSDTDSFTTDHSQFITVSGIFFFGVLLLGIGLIWNSYFPMNKALWTSSYVCATSGIALLLLGTCYWLIDIHGYKSWAKPFVIFGMNAMPLFVFSGLFARMIAAYRVNGPNGSLINVQRWFINEAFTPILSPIDASLAFAITFVLLWLFFMWLLYRKNIFVRV